MPADKRDKFKDHRATHPSEISKSSNNLFRVKIILKILIDFG
jgi:hypothetical protein